MTISIERGDNERSIVAPDLRLRFHRLAEGWTHAIDLGPGPWKTVAEAVKWSSADGGRSPLYQEVELQAGEVSAIARAIGRAGDCEFSATFRVWSTAWEQDHFRIENIRQKRWRSYVEINVADASQTPGGVQAWYVVHDPPACSYLGDSRDDESSEGFHRDWRPFLVWEADVPDNYDVVLSGAEGDPSARVAIADLDPSGDWLVRVAPFVPSLFGTNGFAYVWSHHRVQVFDKATMTRRGQSA